MEITKETRRESYGAAKQDAAARRRVILEILTERGQLTAREVAAELYRRGITPVRRAQLFRAPAYGTESSRASRSDRQNDM